MRRARLVEAGVSWGGFPEEEVCLGPQQRRRLGHVRRKAGQEPPRSIEPGARWEHGMVGAPD